MLSSIRKMKSNKLPIFFQNIEFSLSKFDRLDPKSKLSNCESENSIGWKRFGSFISLHLAYRRKSVCFCSFYETKRALKINAPNSFFENESNFFYIISDFFNKFLKT